MGTFHFEYYDLDAHMTTKHMRVNVNAPDRQMEMVELVNYIVRFEPTAIVVESGANSSYLMRRYLAYRTTDTLTRADEEEQIGFRVMKRFDLDTI